MTTGPRPICMDCKNFDFSDEADGFNCLAYPAGIPDEIIYCAIDHTKPYKGDHGIVFEPRSLESNPDS